jgi:Type II CAAX prenyl endopeptidase Rce1-like
VLSGAGALGATAAAVTSVLLAPALEELVYRGFLLPSLTKRLPATAAVSRAVDRKQVCTLLGVRVCRGASTHCLQPMRIGMDITGLPPASMQQHATRGCDNRCRWRSARLHLRRRT